MPKQLNSEILFFDATLRDGSHAVRHQITTDCISGYCKAIDDAGLYTVIVGHGNGLGASSLQVGLSRHTDIEMLEAARPYLKKTKLGVYLIPGFGTIAENIAPALSLGVSLVKVGCHCTEADTTTQHITYVTEHKAEAYGVLMMTHMASPETLLEQAKKMVDAGARGVILMDSAGALMTGDVTARISLLARNLPVKVGFHAHNNLGLAVGNTVAAIEAGALIIDGTLRGFGAGAGNCPLEIVCGILPRMNRKTKAKLYPLMDCSEDIVGKQLQTTGGITAASLMGGLSGVFSAFNEHVKRAAQQFNVDPRDIYIELGRLKVVGGQEDMIVDVAMNISQRKKEDNMSHVLESLL